VSNRSRNSQFPHLRSSCVTAKSVSSIGFQQSQVFDIETLETAWQEATEPSQREHVTLYIRASDAFRSKNVENVLNMSAYKFVREDIILRWTVDYPEDLEFVREVYSRLTGDSHWIFDQQSVLELLERTPELREINEDRNT